MKPLVLAELLPDPEAEVFCRRLEWENVVKNSVVESCDDWFYGFRYIGVINNPFYGAADVPPGMNANLVTVPVHPPARMPLWNLGKKVTPLKTEIFP